MHYEMIKTHGKSEDVKIIISPSDNLEREFFNQLFGGEVIFETVPNTEQIIIKKEAQVSIGPA
tara:strand:- start:338 stop:526 length:189 start_codon:yes stop_codon:yes gene_type:complete